MKKWWLAQSERINALSLRERVFMFLSILACCLALADVMWLSPAQVAHKQLRQRFEQQNIELKRVRAELKSSATPVDGIKSVREEVTALQGRINEVNQTINNALPSKAQGTPLAQVLPQLLRKHEGLTLERAEALPAQAALEKAVQASVPPAAGALGLTRQGVELTVSGPYPELVRYVQTLETALPYVRWGALRVKSDTQATELTLQLFLLGVQP